MKASKLGLVGLLAGVLALSGGVMFAQGPGQGQGGGGRMQGMMFQQMDTNKDGKVSRAEWDAFHSERFKQIDKNGDGSVDLTEFKADPMKGKGRMMK